VECSEKNPKGAGQVAMNLAQYLSDLNSCEIKIEERLKSLVDMMQSTSMVFAPIVLGITSSLIGLISEFGNSSSELITQTVLMVGIYVVELVAVISYFTVFLLGHKTWKEVGYEFGRRAPVGLAIFISVSIFCQIGLTLLL
jgi:ABC-type polysaccharide transport system permease subunit